MGTQEDKVKEMPEYTQNYEIVAHLQGLINAYKNYRNMGHSPPPEYYISDLEELIEKIMPKDKV